MDRKLYGTVENLERLRDGSTIDVVVEGGLVGVENMKLYGLEDFGIVAGQCSSFVARVESFHWDLGVAEVAMQLLQVYFETAVEDDRLEEVLLVGHCFGTADLALEEVHLAWMAEDSE